MTRLALVLAFLAAAGTADAQVTPPRAGSWKTTTEDGKADALKRNVPLLVYVAYDGPAAELQTKSFDDPSVVRLLGHFACVFLAKEYDLTKFQTSYVPWVGVTPDTTYRPPVLSFGLPKDGPKAALRVEGVGLEAGELVAQLEKVLAALAPLEYQKARTETLDQSKFGEVVKRLDQSLVFLEAALSETTAPKFKEEFPWAVSAVKHAESKASKEFKDKDAKKKAADLLADLKKDLSALEKFKGKEPDKFRDPLLKAREKVKALQELQP